MCISPIKLKTGYVVGCGRCGYCLRNKRDQWSLRLYHEYQSSLSGFFITLTYTDDNLPYGEYLSPILNKTDLQQFFKRLRHKNDLKIKYYAVGEYGTKTERPHYHAILFNMTGDRAEVHTKVHAAWQLGHVHVGNVTQQSIDYVTSYISDRYSDKYGDLVRPFALISKGIGKEHREKAGDYYEEHPGRNQYGQPVSVPRYYRRKPLSRIYGLCKNEKAIDERVEKEKEQIEGYRRQGYADPYEELYARRRANNSKLLKPKKSKL